jgi:hypothetical protein
MHMPKLRLSSEIDKLAKAYCGENQDSALYQQAKIIAQCDFFIARLRTAEANLIDQLRDMPAFSRSKQKRPLARLAEPSSDDATNNVRIYARAFLSALPQLDQLARLENHFWIRRTRALQTFLAVKK